MWRFSNRSVRPGFENACCSGLFPESIAHPTITPLSTCLVAGGGRNRIGRREKWPKKSWEEGEIRGKIREEGEKEKLGVGRIELDGPG